MLEPNSHEVDRPVEGGGGGGELEAVHAEGRVEDTVSVRSVTDDGLGGGVGATPVAAPAGLLAVLMSASSSRPRHGTSRSQDGTHLVGVVAADDHTVLVRVEERVPRAEGGRECLGLGAEVELEDGVGGAVGVDVVLGEGGDLVRLPEVLASGLGRLSSCTEEDPLETLLEHAALRTIAALVDGDVGNIGLEVAAGDALLGSSKDGGREGEERSDEHGCLFGCGRLVRNKGGCRDGSCGDCGDGEKTAVGIQWHPLYMAAWQLASMPSEHISVVGAKGAGQRSEKVGSWAS